MLMIASEPWDRSGAVKCIIDTNAKIRRQAPLVRILNFCCNWSDKHRDLLGVF